MYKYLPALLSIFLSSCSQAPQQQATVILSNNAFLTDAKDTSKATRNILKKYLPSILARAKTDTSMIYYGSPAIEDDSLSRQLVIGKLINKKMISVVEINLKTDSINFFNLIDGAWKSAGKEQINIGVIDTVRFEDFDADTNNELFTSTQPNMNGNSWMEIYHYASASDSIKYAGSFSTGYEVQKSRRQLEETYGGSWYMDESKTLYQWQQNKLIPIKKIILAHDTPISYESKITFEYYENLSNRFDGLKLKFKERYNENNKRQNKLWDNFFAKAE